MKLTPVKYTFCLVSILIFFNIHCKRDISYSEETSVNKLEPNDWQYQQRAYPLGKINTNAFPKSIAYRKQKLKKNLITKNDGKNVEEWEFIGPTNIGGRVTAVAKDATGVTYIGAASGGIFRSSDNDTWIPIFENEASLSIGDIAIAPTNQKIIYVGTGEANAGGGSVAYDGFGMYKSINAGNTWEHIGLENSGSIGKVLVHPTDNNIVYVGVVGNLFSNSPERGLYKSEDGGGSWENILYLNDSTGVVDIAMHPENHDIIYATSWERVRKPDRRSYSGPSSGIHRSVNGGETWEKLSNGLPTEPGRIGIAISKSDPNILYSTVGEKDTEFMDGVYKTEDGGDSWTKLNDSGIINPPFMYWFGKIYVDPKNPNVVYLPSLLMHKSTNGGQERWATIFAEAHLDQHVMHIDPEKPLNLTIGNDGGVYTSGDGGINYEKSEGIPITQFYTCEIDFLNPERIYGGTQDNGTLRTLTSEEDQWHQIYTGDGFRALVDPSNSDNVYVESQYGNLQKSIDGGNTFVFGRNGIDTDERFNWNTPIAFDPQNPLIMYIGSSRLYKSTNGAFTWRPISPDLTGNPKQKNLLYGSLTSISVSPLDQNKIWVGSDNGKVHLTSDGGRNWEPVSEELPNRWVTSVITDPFNRSGAYVTFSGYKFGENKGHIFHTLNDGSNWNDISGDLPDVPINDLDVNPNSGALYIATDIGVFKSLDNGNSWSIIGLGLPNTVISDIDFHPPTNLLVAATFGRGMYRATLQDQVTSTEEFDLKKLDLNIAPNPLGQSTRVSIRIEKKGRYHIAIFNTNGKIETIIHDGDLIKGEIDWDINSSNWPRGIYILRASAYDGSFRGYVKMLKE